MISAPTQLKRTRVTDPRLQLQGAAPEAVLVTPELDRMSVMVTGMPAMAAHRTPLNVDRLTHDS